MFKKTTAVFLSKLVKYLRMIAVGMSNFKENISEEELGHYR